MSQNLPQVFSGIALDTPEDCATHGPVPIATGRRNALGVPMVYQ